jgi:cytochrome P450
MLDYASNLVAERRQPGTHPNDLLQSLVDAANGSDRLDDEELRIMILTLIAGGYDTTKNLLICIMKLLADYPNQWEKLENDPKRVRGFIEETLRYLNPIGMDFRVPNVDIEYRDVLIPANTMIGLPIFIAGRDPKANSEADVFNPDRKTPKHVTFGQGMHMCVGMFLARAILEEGIPIIVSRLRRPRIIGEIRARPFQAIWGLQNLPISFEPLTEVSTASQTQH